VLNSLTNIDALVTRLTWIADESTDLQVLLGLNLEEFVVQSGVSRATMHAEAERR
jgi:hypothetical protein